MNANPDIFWNFSSYSNVTLDVFLICYLGIPPGMTE